MSPTLCRSTGPPAVVLNVFILATARIVFKVTFRYKTRSEMDCEFHVPRIVQEYWSPNPLIDNSGRTAPRIVYSRPLRTYGPSMADYNNEPLQPLVSSRARERIVAEVDVDVESSAGATAEALLPLSAPFTPATALAVQFISVKHCSHCPRLSLHTYFRGTRQHGDRINFVSSCTHGYQRSADKQ